MHAKDIPRKSGQKIPPKIMKLLNKNNENLRCCFDFERFAGDCEINGDIFSTGTEEGTDVFSLY